MIGVICYFAIMLSPLFPPLLLAGVDVVRCAIDNFSRKDEGVARARKENLQAVPATATG